MCMKPAQQLTPLYRRHGALTAVIVKQTSHTEADLASRAYYVHEPVKGTPVPELI